jgi:hypothetical protein
MRKSLLVLFLVVTGACLAGDNTPKQRSTTTKHATSAAVPSATDKQFAKRALKTDQTLTDKIGRQLVAQIIRVNSNSLEVRRNADQKILLIPVAALSAKDQAFADYLRRKQYFRPGKTTQTSPQAMKGLVAMVK